ncbi:hypothetical protein ACLMJK_004944 [Lecanora helva]
MGGVVPSLTSPIPPIPRPPSPSADKGILAANEDPSPSPSLAVSSETLNVFSLKPLEALKILCDFIENLVRTASDAPPTPPISQPSTPQLDSSRALRENLPLRLKEGDSKAISAASKDDEDVPLLAKTPIGSPEAHATEPLHVIGPNMEPVNVQRGAVARKFYSKKPPPIRLEEYLARLHKFCPMSTAVYLATSLYIYRLAVNEKSISVTARNIHRLVLAGLRVAMKALEDQSYAHRRFAKVGGVSEPELGRLEISFCFITNFELRVDEKMLVKHVQDVRAANTTCQIPEGLQLERSITSEKRRSVAGQANASGLLINEAHAAA